MFYSGLCFGTDDLEKSGDFYDKVFKTIGVIRHQTTDNEVGYGKNLINECFLIFNKKNARQWINDYYRRTQGTRRFILRYSY